MLQQCRDNKMGEKQQHKDSLSARIKTSSIFISHGILHSPIMKDVPIIIIS